MNEPGPVTGTGPNPSQNGCTNDSLHQERCKATPLERVNGPGASPISPKPDPYVAGAAERARNKLRDRIFQLNGGRAH